MDRLERRIFHYTKLISDMQREKQMTISLLTASTFYKTPLTEPSPELSMKHYPLPSSPAHDDFPCKCRDANTQAQRAKPATPHSSSPP